MTFEELKNKNPNLRFLTTADYSPLFTALNYDCGELVAYSACIAADKDNAYIADDERAHNFAVVEKICRERFAEINLQVGWCTGGGIKLNGVEWHKSPEVIVACTDMVLLLGDFKDIKDDSYNSANAIALFMKKGEVVELAPLTLHLAPLAVDDRFKATIILPFGTNAPLKGGIDGTLRAVNKWLLVHPENAKGVALGGKVGVVGENIELVK